MRTDQLEHLWNTLRLTKNYRVKEKKDLVNKFPDDPLAGSETCYDRMLDKSIKDVETELDKRTDTTQAVAH